ncbi:MAG: hypothetical protein O2819_01405 [Planctomycetota bacterium]|nr:hypothetical protein [Planctomycetota bacterium]MDA1105006.1 hypothetical protein [Planctomycetota bacterium]
MDLGLWSNHFSIQQKLVLRLDLPARREPILDFFDRIRREFPDFHRMHREDRLHVLEARQGGGESMLVGLLDTELFSAHANPGAGTDAYRLHRSVLEAAPCYLSITPLDVESLELTYAFQFEAPGNRDEIVAEALLRHSPLGRWVPAGDGALLDCQPFTSFTIDAAAGLHGLLEVRTRTNDDPGSPESGPIFVDFTVRRTGAVNRIEELSHHLDLLATQGEALIAERLLPTIIHPLRDAILTGGGN